MGDTKPAPSLGQRIQVYLRHRFGRDAAKKVAAMTGVDVRTARGWVEEGRAPRGAALLAIIRDMGRDGLLELFSVEIEDHEARIFRTIQEHKKAIARLQSELFHTKSARIDAWNEDNRDAIESWNELVEREGLWSDGLRAF